MSRWTINSSVAFKCLQFDTGNRRLQWYASCKCALSRQCRGIASFSFYLCNYPQRRFRFTTHHEPHVGRKSSDSHINLDELKCIARTQLLFLMAQWDALSHACAFSQTLAKEEKKYTHSRIITNTKWHFVSKKFSILKNVATTAGIAIYNSRKTSNINCQVAAADLWIDIDL